MSKKKIRDTLKSLKIGARCQKKVPKLKKYELRIFEDFFPISDDAHVSKYSSLNIFFLQIYFFKEKSPSL